MNPQPFTPQVLSALTYDGVTHLPSGSLVQMSNVKVCKCRIGHRSIAEAHFVGPKKIYFFFSGQVNIAQRPRREPGLVEITTEIDRGENFEKRVDDALDQNSEL